MFFVFCCHLQEVCSCLFSWTAMTFLLKVDIFLKFENKKILKSSFFYFTVCFDKIFIFLLLLLYLPAPLLVQGMQTIHFCHTTLIVLLPSVSPFTHIHPQSTVTVGKHRSTKFDIFPFPDAAHNNLEICSSTDILLPRNIFNAA